MKNNEVGKCLQHKLAKHGERKTSERFPSWIVDDAYKIVDDIEALISKCLDEVSDDVWDQPPVVAFRVRLDLLRRFSRDVADDALYVETGLADEDITI